MPPGLFTILTEGLSKLFRPIRAVLDNPGLLEPLLNEIGATPDSAGGDSLLNALSAIAGLASQLDALSTVPSPSFAEIAAVLESSGKVFHAVQALGQAGGPAAALENFGLDLIDLLLAIYLSRWHPLAREVAALLTLLDPVETQDQQPGVIKGGNLIRLPYRVDRFHLNRLPRLVRDPVGTLRADYVNDLLTVADANAMADSLFPRVLDILRLLGVSCRYGFTPGDESLMGDAGPLIDHALVIYTADRHAWADAEAGAVLTFSSADRGDLGLLVSPFGALQVQTNVWGWAIEFDFTADVEGVAYGRHGATIVASAATTKVDGKFTATLAAPSDGPAFILGALNGSRLEVGGALLTAATSLTEAKQTLALSGEVSKSVIVISPGDGDGFLGSVIPKDGLQTKFDLGVAWSNDGGLTFKGAAGLDATLPVGISIGGVITIPTVHLALQAEDAGLVAEVSIASACRSGRFRQS